ITSYIPTNVISITDGQIYLENDLFYAGVRPAINVGLSVSRVGGKAQKKAMRKVAGKLRLDLAQYRELVAFTQFGTELDKTTQAQLNRGERVVEILKQGEFAPLSIPQQVIIIYYATQGHLDDLPVQKIKKFEGELHQYLQKEHPEIEEEIVSKDDLSEELIRKLDSMIVDFKAQFNKTN
ncbi:MAG: F0F1 ATP synthase subunit alpha, partial [Candidatus Omnitrophica bacterium]|nr:F0F1 ATP synthase subunit alpha [Candidatus Omnitrophota bacterium]